MHGLQLPFFGNIDGASSVLISGAGGGFDVLSGLPLFYALRDSGKRVYLANLSFTNLRSAAGAWLGPKLMEVTPETQTEEAFFPERALSCWLREEGYSVPVYAFERGGVRSLVDSYKILVNTLKLDAIILADGGTDSLMRGDEFDLGTPEEDIASILAVNELDVERKSLVCLGFGVDTFHGVCHAQFLENVSSLIRDGAYLGAFSLTEDMPAVNAYRQAVRSVLEQSPPEYVSIVCTSINSAIEGRFGDYHATNRTRESRLFINPLMSIYWCFDIAGVASRILYGEAARGTETFEELVSVIAEFRAKCTPRPWKDIPA
ncbi:MAG: DUF1152 domain-containing protein [Pirellulaceae bacterium]